MRHHDGTTSDETAGGTGAQDRDQGAAAAAGGSVRFAEALAPWLAAGWPEDAFLPGIPVGATLAEGATVSADSIGKVPGRYRGKGVWVGLAGAWDTRGLAGCKPSLTLAAVRRWPTMQVCIRARACAGLDCDIGDDAHASALVLRAWAEVLERDPTDVARRGRGNARWLAPMRGVGVLNSGSFRKVEIVDPIGNVVGHVELKAAGHWVGAGTHPSGAAYVWANAKGDAWDGGIPSWEALPGVEEATLGRFRECLKAMLEAEGYEVRPVRRGASGAAPGGSGSTGERRRTADLPCLLSLDTLERLLRVVDCKPETVARTTKRRSGSIPR